jgi:hypothetical protein
MQSECPVLEKLQIAHNLVSEALCEAPQLYDYHLDQALLVLVLSMRRARRSPRLRYRSPYRYSPNQSSLPF